MAEERKNIVGCHIYGVTESIHFKCNYCKENFCGIHRNTINHSCPFVNIYRKKRQERILSNLKYRLKTCHSHK